MRQKMGKEMFQLLKQNCFCLFMIIYNKKYKYLQQYNIISKVMSSQKYSRQQIIKNYVPSEQDIQLIRYQTIRKAQIIQKKFKLSNQQYQFPRINNDSDQEYLSLDEIDQLNCDVIYDLNAQNQIEMNLKKQNKNRSYKYIRQKILKQGLNSINCRGQLLDKKTILIQKEKNRKYMSQNYSNEKSLKQLSLKSFNEGIRKKYEKHIIFKESNGFRNNNGKNQMYNFQNISYNNSIKNKKIENIHKLNPIKKIKFFDQLFDN